MGTFRILFLANLKRRCTDGFAVGYNVVFPLVLIWLLGLLCKGGVPEGILNSFQYYGVVIVPFCIFLSIITAAYGGKDDAYANTADRILVAPVSNGAIVISKIAAETIVFAGCSFLVLVVSFFFWDVCGLWHMGKILLLYLCASYAAACIGTCLGLAVKEFLKLKNVINIPILVFAILGGCFYPFGTLDRGLRLVLSFSPLRWINKSQFLLLYDDNPDLFYLVCVVLAAVGSIFMLLTILFFKREEYGNGELPGYEK